MADSDLQSDPNSDKYVVVARRYRPKSFGELVGQGHVGQALKNAIETNRVGHAYLFTGARGVGKTSTARIFAKALNAPEGPTATPDNDSDICQAIDAGEDIDVLEIDGASNRGIDEIRSLRAGVGVRPSRARYKIYIIDEVHMLTTAAFNALLKTLEEPPEHVKFIFCTTDPEKIPITVLSRCQRFDFAPVHADEIMGRLREIIDSEKAEADDEALRLLSRRAAGSMRDSQSLLEQVLSFSSGKLTVETVHSMLGTADDQRLHDLTTALIDRDAKSAIEQADLATQAGVDAGQLGEQLLGHFRDLLIATVGCEPAMLRFCSESMHEELKKRGASWGVATILAVVSLLDQTLVRIRQSVHGRVLLEIALIQICQLPDLQRMADLMAGVKQSTPARISAAGEKKKSEPIAAAPAASSPATAQPAAADAPASAPELSQQAETPKEPQAQPESSAPAQTVPAETAPAETAPAETAPAETAPAETAPAQTAPAQTAPAQTAPAQTAPAQTAPAQTAPAQTAPAQTAPAETAPAETAPAQTAPAQTAPAETAPAETAPAQTAPAQTAPAETAVATPATTPAAAATQAPPATPTAPTTPPAALSPPPPPSIENLGPADVSEPVGATPQTIGTSKPPPPRVEPAATPAPAEAAASEAPKTPSPPKELPTSYPPPEWTPAGVLVLWKRSIERLDDLTADLARQYSKVELVEEGRIRVLFPADLKLTKSRCDKPEQKSKLEEALAVVAARHVLIESGFDKNVVSQPRAQPVSTSAERKQRHRGLQTDPYVKKCMELFDLEVVRVDDPRPS